MSNHAVMILIAKRLAADPARPSNHPREDFEAAMEAQAQAYAKRHGVTLAEATAEVSKTGDYQACYAAYLRSKPSAPVTKEVAPGAVPPAGHHLHSDRPREE